MHPTASYYQLSQDHFAGLRHQAQRHALARAARHARAVLGPRNDSSAPGHERHVLVQHQAQPSGHSAASGR